jgi:hypothetical protein
MTGVFSILGFVAELKACERDLERLGPAIVEKACQIIQKKAKAAIGKEHELWAPLAGVHHPRQAGAWLRHAGAPATHRRAEGLDRIRRSRQRRCRRLEQRHRGVPGARHRQDPAA